MKGGWGGGVQRLHTPTSLVFKFVAKKKFTFVPIWGLNTPYWSGRSIIYQYLNNGPSSLSKLTGSTPVAAVFLMIRKAVVYILIC